MRVVSFIVIAIYTWIAVTCSYRTLKKENGDISTNLSVRIQHKEISKKQEDSFDLEFVSRLTSVQKNIDQPLLVDCVVVKKDGYLEVFGIVNFENMPLNAPYHKHVKYTLHFNNLVYKNKMPDHWFTSRVQVLNFTIPFRDNVTEMDFKIVDNRYKITYPVNTRVLVPPPRKKRLAVCAYVSDYNSVNEVRSWLAYYKMIGVDNVILYTALELKDIHDSLSKQIESGFLRWYKYYWPLRKHFEYIQRNVQLSQINSCFYRHRHEYEYMILLDVDEYMLSYKNPFNMYESIINHFTDYVDVLIVQANMFGMPKEDLQDREVLLYNGTIFDKYTCWLENSVTKREKLILHSRASGFFGNHDCCNCRTRRMNMDDLRVFHLRVTLGEYKNIPQFCNANHSYLTNELQNVLKTICFCLLKSLLINLLG